MRLRRKQFQRVGEVGVPGSGPGAQTGRARPVPSKIPFYQGPQVPEPAQPTTRLSRGSGLGGTSRLAAGLPRRSFAYNQVPYTFEPLKDAKTYTPVTYKPQDSDTQGLGKSPGFRWPWWRFFVGSAPSVYHNYGFPYRSELPTRILVRGEIGPLSRQYLEYYEQASRHVWPGGGVIEYGPSVPLTAVARRLA